MAIHALAAALDGAPVRIAGRVVDVHANGLVLEDATGHIQVHGEGAAPPGALCEVVGTWREGRVHAQSLTVLGGDERVFRAGSDYRRLHAGVPLGHLQARARLMRELRRFFDERGYLEVETPLAVPSPGLDLHLNAFEVADCPSARFLITSPEYQMKRLLSAGAERIYQVAKCFRRDEQGALHEAEFSMLEWYQAYCSMRELMDETEALVVALATVARPDAPALGVSGHHLVSVAGPFERLSVREAFSRYAGCSADELATDEERFYRVLVERVEPQLGRERPTFLTHYPASMASLARLCPEDPSVAERFELYVDGVELCNGFGELTDAQEQRQRLMADQRARKARGLPAYPIDERFLDALRDGLPPCAGNALGLDRLCMLALGHEAIQPVLAFPSHTL